MSFSVSVPLLLRKDTAFLAKQKSVEILERFVYLSCFKTLCACLSVNPFACLCPSFTNKELLRKDTVFLAKQKSVEIRERFVYLSYLEEFVFISFILSVCLYVYPLFCLCPSVLNYVLNVFITRAPDLT